MKNYTLDYGLFQQPEEEETNEDDKEDYKRITMRAAGDREKRQYFVCILYGNEKIEFSF